MYTINTRKINGVKKIRPYSVLKDYNGQLYIHACIFFFFTKVPFDAKEYFFSHSSVPFQNFSFATLYEMVISDLKFDIILLAML